MTDWNLLRSLPMVASWNKGRRSPTWQNRREEYAALPKTTLIITADLVTPVIHAEASSTHLDGILSFAALTTFPVVSTYERAAVVPLPLELAWVSPRGLPLWACTPLIPAVAGIATREYWHKRYPSHRSEFGRQVSAVTTAGRWKEYRVPVHAQSVERLRALAIGDSEAVSHLLQAVTHIGKKGSMGYGRVAQWTVKPASHSLHDVLALRNVPAAYYADAEPCGVLAPLRGWTPPYWYAPWWEDCWVPA